MAQESTLRKTRNFIGKTLIVVILLAGAVIFLFPFLWMLSTSLKTPQEIIAIPTVWIPKKLQWQNYSVALSYFPFLRYLANTLYLVMMNMLGTVLSSALVGYAFARLRWPGREFWFKILLATMMLPATVTMVPQFILFKNFGWLDSYLPLIVPAFAGSATNIFLLRQFFRTIPNSLSECARLDGCGELRIFWKIILPLCKPALATVAIFTFMFTWNDFMGPLLYINDKMRYTLSYGLRTFQIQSDSKWHLTMAASVVVALPSLALFFSFQRYFIEGITLTGLKE
ncbi:MAG: carbohydrate ABC transporter permease [Clostridia bacterium]|nr:carbohydrate ABC transporter permease [Clostridia bacterium]